VNSVNSSIIIKGKDKSRVATDRNYYESNFDGSTGGMTGIRQSPSHINHLAKAMLMVGGGAPLTEHLPSFDNSSNRERDVKKTHMT
jgi:hypothetical protein